MTFSDQSAISAHYDTAHAERGRPEHSDARYECEVCGKKLVHNHHMKRHMATVHGIGDVKTFQCDICSRVFKEKSTLTKHLNTVHLIGNVKNFQCDVCSRVFKRKDYLKDHLKNVHRD